MADKGKDSKGTWKDGDLDVVKLVIDGKVVKRASDTKPKKAKKEKK